MPEQPVAAPFTGLTLEATAFTKTQLLEPYTPQVALAGRSNVGKSSLVNALAGRKKLAKVSATPGKTRSINYYRVNGMQGFIVDLPGYGYARCSKEERRKWADLMEFYFRHTPGLKALALLLDSRLPPQKTDRELAAFAEALALPLVPILTKADKVSKKELQTCVRAWEPLVGESSLVPTSARTGKGLDALGMVLVSLLTPD